MAQAADMADLIERKWINRKRHFWKGDNLNGWQICMDEKRTKGNVGQVMPVLITYPVGGQFTAMVDILEEDPVTGEKVTNQVPMWQYKGFRQVAEVVDADGNVIKRPSEAIVEALLERRITELTQDMKEKNLRPDEIREECEAFRQLVYEANGMGKQVAEDAVTRVKRNRRKKVEDGKG